MRFLTDYEIQKQVKKIASQNSDLMAAVAYWGRGAAERTGLKDLVKNEQIDIRIICDLLSGACNPSEIEELIGTPGIHVRKLDRLHAKVWIGGEHVIVGSANASSSGLPSKEDSHANIEAAVLFAEESIAEQAKCWFNRQWGTALDITDRDIDLARDLWNQRQRYVSDRSFDIHFDRLFDLRLVVYPSGFTSEAQAIFDELEDGESCYEWPLEGGPEWSEQPGTVLMDFEVNSKAKLSFDGFWQVSNRTPVRLSNSMVTFLKEPPPEVHSSLCKKEKRRIYRKIHAWLKKLNYRVDKFENYIDTNFREFWLQPESN